MSFITRLMKMMHLCILSSICLCPACKLHSSVFFILNRSLWELITTRCVNIREAGIVRYIRFFFPCTVKLSYTNYSTEECFLLQFFFLLLFHLCFPKLLKSPSELQTCRILARIMYVPVETGLGVSLLCGNFFVVVLSYRLFLPCFITKAADE